jgi:esterase/lipase
MSGADEELLRDEIDRYRTDYRYWCREGESKDLWIGMPRLLRGREGAAGLIILHGYMAAPEELALLAERLNASGLTVYLPRLPGHGTSPANLASVGWADWAGAADSAWRRVSGLCPRWVISGFSTGAGLALHEAAIHPERYAALISMAAPLGLVLAPGPFVRWADRLLAAARRAGLAGSGAGFFPNRPDNPGINYHRNCIHGVAEVQRLLRVVGAELGSIAMPALVMQGSGDRVVKRGSARRIFEGLSSREKSLDIVPSDRHCIVRGPALGETSSAILRFLGKTGLA